MVNLKTIENFIKEGVSKDAKAELNEMTLGQLEKNEPYKIKLLTTIDGISVYLIDSSLLSQKHDVWNTYLGSHHYGKKSSHIPEDEIFISDKTPLDELKRVILHEYVERAIMKVLETQHDMSPEQAWEIAHYFVKDNLGL